MEKEFLNFLRGNSDYNTDKAISSLLSYNLLPYMFEVQRTSNTGW
jgi:hypothetical protein